MKDLVNILVWTYLAIVIAAILYLIAAFILGVTQ